MTPPYQPTVSGPEDTSNFDIEELRPPRSNNAAGVVSANSKDSLLNIHLPFVGFTSTFTAPGYMSETKQRASLTESCEDIRTGDSIPPTLPLTTEPEVPIKNDFAKLEEVQPSAGRVKQLESELRSARQEWSELSTILGEIRKEKSVISTRLREKEGELEEQLEKLAQLRQQLRNSERIKRQNLDEIEGVQKELEKERQLRKESKFFITFTLACDNNFF